MAAHQAPPSPGFSRQEHWSGLPFPSPMHESEKWKWSRWVGSDSSRPHGLQPTRLLHPWDFPGKSTGVECHCLLPYFLKIELNSIGLIPPRLDLLSKFPEKMLSSSYSPIFRAKSFLFELTLDALNWLPQLISLSESYWKWKVLVAQPCPTLWDPMDYTPPGSSVHGILLKTFNSFLWLN